MYKLAGIKGRFAVRWITLSIIISILPTSFSSEVFANGDNFVFEDGGKVKAVEFDNVHKENFAFKSVFVENIKINDTPIIVVSSELIYPVEKLTVSKSTRFTSYSLKVVASATSTFRIAIDIKDKFIRRAYLNKNRGSKQTLLTVISRPEVWFVSKTENAFKIGQPNKQHFSQIGKNFSRKPKVAFLLC